VVTGGLVLCMGFFVSAGLIGCRSPEKNEKASGKWPASAAIAARTLSEWNFDCLAEGRERYPSHYSCTHMDESRSGSVVLYADDRNELVGIRVFAPAPESILFKIGFTLAFGDGWQNLIDSDWASAETHRTIDDILVETGRDPSGLFIRLTPVSRIQ